MSWTSPRLVLLNCGWWCGPVCPWFAPCCWKIKRWPWTRVESLAQRFSWPLKAKQVFLVHNDLWARNGRRSCQRGDTSIHKWSRKITPSFSNVLQTSRNLYLWEQNQIYALISSIVDSLKYILVYWGWLPFHSTHSWRHWSSFQQKLRALEKWKCDGSRKLSLYTTQTVRRACSSSASEPYC